ncbi:MAG: hypothetical protein SPI37_03205 [Eubacteriales bacterium]|nr:hypothetical protein [Clostridium sp.]MDY5002192.1 hypothetical protein [Eubacteriales bacterium]MDY6088586.1 hypothetical protein [Eubacteriales bacterium]
MRLQDKSTNFEALNDRTFDFAKLICAYLIVAIHCPPFLGVSSTINFYVTHVIARIAVPFFFATTAFFLFRKMKFIDGKIANNISNIRCFWRYIKRNVLLYAIWSVIYLIWQIPNWYATGWWGIHVVKDYLISFVLSGSFYHLWYMVSLFYGIVFLYVMLRFIGIKGTAIISCALYLVKALSYGYTWLNLPGLTTVTSLFDRFGGVFGGLCLAVPMMMVGVVCGQCLDWTKKLDRFRLLGLIASSILLSVEASLLQYLGLSKDKVSFIVMTLPVCFFIFINVRKISFKNERLGKCCKMIRSASTLIYCVHPLLLCLWSLLNTWSDLSSISRYIILCVSSTVFAAIVLLIEKSTRMKILKYLH